MRQFPDAHFIRYLSFFNTEVLVCNSLEACRDVLQTHCYSIRKSDWYMRSGKDILGKGLIAQEGAEHRIHRRILSAPFSFANIRKLEPLFKEKAKGLSAVLHRAVENGEDGGKTGVIDCTEIFSKAFLDIIGVATLGKELSQLDTIGFGTEHEESGFHRAYTEFFAPPDKLKQLLTFLSGFYPVRWLPLQANRDFKSAMDALHGACTALIQERFAERGAKVSKATYEKDGSTDLLTFMVDEILHGETQESLAEEVLLGDVSLEDCISSTGPSFLPLTSIGSFSNSSEPATKHQPIRCLGLCWFLPRTMSFKTIFEPRSLNCWRGMMIHRTQRLKICHI